MKLLVKKKEFKMKKIKIASILLCAMLAMSFLSGCSLDKMTVFYNELTYNTKYEQTEIYLKITNNTSSHITIYASDFSIETSNGQKAASAFRSSNYLVSKIDFTSEETGYIYLTFNMKLSEITNKECIYYLDSKIEILKQTKVSI